MEAQALDVMARTIYGEARGESWEGMLAVGWVIKNRAQQGGWWGATVPEVCRKPRQFSCWNASDPNRAACTRVTAHDSTLFRSVLAAAACVLSGLCADNTGGATHYYATSREPPIWARGRTPTVTIGKHSFFRDID
jgi:spore germination cell wall hydrolase CwlJ-like protein